MRLVPIECVNEESYLAKDIYDDYGRILLKKGIKLKKVIIEKIKAINIYSIYIDDKYSDKIIEDVIKPEIRNQVVKKVKETFVLIDEHFKNSKNEHDSEFYKKNSECFENIQSMIVNLIEEMLYKKDVMIRLVDIKTLSNYLYRHSVNVCIISLIIGVRLKFHKFELLDLCVGAILHDIGKIFIPKEILNKKGKLTHEEFNIVKKHSQKGYEYLKDSSEISLPSKIIVWQHHERIGGQGYPQGINGNKILVLSKIVALADVYDAMTSDRVYRKAFNPNEVMEYIMANAGTQFDYNIVKYFVKSIVPYPEGTLVRLNTGDIAVVEKINSDMLLRPNVKIIYSKDGKNINKTINLTKKLNIVIEKVVKNLKNIELIS